MNKETNAGFKHRLSRTCVPAIGSLLSSKEMGVALVLDVVGVEDDLYDVFRVRESHHYGEHNVIRHVDGTIDHTEPPPFPILAIKLNTSEGVKWGLYHHTTYDSTGDAFDRTYWVGEDTPTFNEVYKGLVYPWRPNHKPKFNRSLHSIK